MTDLSRVFADALAAHRRNVDRDVEDGLVCAVDRLPCETERAFRARRMVNPVAERCTCVGCTAFRDREKRR